MIIDWLAQPLTLLCFWLAALALISMRYGVLRIALLNLLTLVLVWTLSSPEFANRWIKHLESTRENPNQCDAADVQHVVVLGGGMNPWIPNSAPRQRLNRDSIQRATAAAQIGGPDTRWYTLGAGANGYTLADDMADILLENGVLSDVIVREALSKSTQENATNFKQIVSPDDAQLIHLVTSALHVERAASIFTDHGYVVCHQLGVDSLYSVPAPPTSLLPFLGGLEKTTAAWREQLARLKLRIQKAMP